MSRNHTSLSHLIMLCLSILLLLSSVNTSSVSQASSPDAPGAFWYVSTTGNDTQGDGSYHRPFLTIQRGMDAAKEGDTVVVQPGRYAGPGNVNLDFKGKGISVQGCPSITGKCQEETVIDAQGEGVIVRFVNDEGPQSVFEGFSLIAGDTTEPVRGVPGFFEFSPDARPTTRGLHILGNAPVTGRAPAPLRMATAIPYGTRVWDGNDPFHQPAATTDYHGSGDVNKDGVWGQGDISAAQNMVVGTQPPSVRADVNGDGAITVEDVALLQEAINGAALPAWWDQLPNREARDAWVDRFLVLDRTNYHPPRYWFQCLSFSTQLYLNGAFYRGDLSLTEFSGGQTIFNIPLYQVSVTAPSFGHAINAILVGDNPLDLDDWRFIEPQNDGTVVPGAWNLPYGATVRIAALSHVTGGSTWSEQDQVTFLIEQTGWQLLEYNPDLRLVRFERPAQTPDNLPDLWNPHLIPVGGGLLLYEQARDDMDRTTDIHLTQVPLSDPPQGAPLTLEPQYSRLLDAFVSHDGEVHLLWTGKPGYVPGVFYGRLDPDTQTLLEVSRVSDETRRQVFMGRLVADEEEIHVFWLEGKANVSHPHTPGIYWSRRTTTGWESAQNLTPDGLDLLPGTQEWEYAHETLPYTFDVALYQGQVVLVWADPVNYWFREIRQRTYQEGTWDSPTLIVNGGQSLPGVDLQPDSAGNLHLAYWSGSTYGRGSLSHLIYNGTVWSAPVLVDANHAGYPRMAADDTGHLYMVWERKVAERVVPAWSTYANGSWSPAETLAVRAGAEAWYPTLAWLPGDALLFAWSSRAAERVTIETYAIYPPLSLHKSVSPQNDVSSGEYVTYTVTFSAGVSELQFQDPLPAEVEYVSGSLTSSTTPLAIYDALNRTIKWEGTVPLHEVQTIQFQAALNNNAYPVNNTAWLTDTNNVRGISSTAILNPLTVYLPLVLR